MKKHLIFFFLDDFHHGAVNHVIHFIGFTVYRGFGKSEDVSGQPSRGHRPEYAIDVLNLIASVNHFKSLMAV